LVNNGVKSNEVFIKLNIEIINIYFVRLRELFFTKINIDLFFFFFFFFLYITLIISFDLKDIIIVFTKINKFIRVRSFVRFYLNELAVFSPSLK